MERWFKKFATKFLCLNSLRTNGIRNRFCLTSPFSNRKNWNAFWNNKAPIQRLLKYISLLQKTLSKYDFLYERDNEDDCVITFNTSTEFVQLKYLSSLRQKVSFYNSHYFANSFSWSTTLFPCQWSLYRHKLNSNILKMSCQRSYSSKVFTVSCTWSILRRSFKDHEIDMEFWYDLIYKRIVRRFYILTN